MRTICKNVQGEIKFHRIRIIIVYLGLLISHGVKSQGNDFHIIDRSEHEVNLLPNKSIVYKSVTSSKWDSLSCEAWFNNDSTKINLHIYNLGKKDVFVYASMFASWTQIQPYVLQLDTIKKINLVSLTPTYGYFKNYVPVNNFILDTHYNWFEYLRVKSNESIIIEIENHFRDSEFCAIEMIDSKNYEVILEKEILRYTNRVLDGYSQNIRIALFDNIDFLFYPNLMKQLHTLKNQYLTIELNVQ